MLIIKTIIMHTYMQVNLYMYIFMCVCTAIKLSENNSGDKTYKVIHTIPA